MKTNNSLKWTIGLILLSSFASCKEAKHGNSGTVIPVKSEVGKYSILNLSDWVSEITYVPLETKDAELITGIREIIYENEKIILFDHQWTETSDAKCLLFSKNGDYIKKLGRKGKGPNDYFRIDQIFTDDDYIYVKESPNFLMRYDFDGNLVRKISAPQGIKEKNQFLNLTCLQSLKKDIFVMDIILDQVKHPTNVSHF